VPALHTARLYLCTDSRRRQGDLEQFLDAVLSNGVDVVQLREKGLEAREEIRLLEVFAAAAERHGALWAANDRADLARAVGAPVLHLGQDDLPTGVAREIVGPDVLIGRSTHSPAQADAARVEPGVAYYCCGPTWATPTKPGRPAAGLAYVEHAARSGARTPWFAIGGIDADTAAAVVEAGARRIVVVRAIADAEDPEAAARTLRAAMSRAAGGRPSSSGRGPGWPAEVTRRRG
jgi:thiamine-phosphate pyrophosphorylase